MTDYLGELRDSARQVLAGTGTPASEDKLWPLLVELGWLLAPVPEHLGGLGLGIEGACSLHTELGGGLSQAAYLPATLCLDAVCHSDLPEPERAAWVERLCSGELGTAPLTDPALTLASGAGALSGLAATVQSADRASHVLLWTADHDCLLLLALDQPGVQITSRATWDVTRRLFDLRVDNAALAEQLVLARGDAARAAVRRLHTLRDLSLAADAIGGAAALLALTLEHLATRRQFGRPLALFQALKHRCADLKTRLAGAEALLQDSLAAISTEAGDAGALHTAHKAKYLACATFLNVAEESLQLHGGIGMADEHPCHLFLKRAMLNEHLGSAEQGYEIAIADHFLGTA